MTTAKSNAAKTRKRNARKHNVKLILGGMVAILAVLGIQNVFNSPHANANATVANVVQEDDPAFNCTTMGNRICAPGNSNGAIPGIYAKDGQLIWDWDGWLANLNRIDHNAKAHH